MNELIKKSSEVLLALSLILLLFLSNEPTAISVRSYLMKNILFVLVFIILFMVVKSRWK